MGRHYVLCTTEGEARKGISWRNGRWLSRHCNENRGDGRAHPVTDGLFSGFIGAKKERKRVGVARKGRSLTITVVTHV